MEKKCPRALIAYQYQADKCKGKYMDSQYVPNKTTKSRNDQVVLSFKRGILL